MARGLIAAADQNAGAHLHAAAHGPAGLQYAQQQRGLEPAMLSVFILGCVRGSAV